jgi:hypothetical protein
MNITFRRCVKTSSRAAAREDQSKSGDYDDDAGDGRDRDMVLFLRLYVDRAGIEDRLRFGVIEIPEYQGANPENDEHDTHQ